LSKRQFGVSTHLYHEERLVREHLAAIAGHGFEAIEVFATQSHFDYRDPGAVDALGVWLVEFGIELHSMHAPIVEAIRQGRWIGSYSLASADDARRRAAVAEAGAALRVAERVPYRYLVLHLGVPDGQSPTAADNDAGAARRSVEEIAELAAGVHVGIAIEVMPNALSGAPAICALIEDSLDGADVGICLDYGHAHLMGDLAEAIETVGGHLWTTHVHDNDGRRDDHAVPFLGRIDWGAAMMETQKIGYDGMMMFEVANSGSRVDVLQRTVRARTELERMLVTY
jgi:sugar phosphate isomerase/epimerase